MRGRQRLAGEDIAAGGAVAVKPGAVPRRLATLRMGASLGHERCNKDQRDEEAEYIGKSRLKESDIFHAVGTGSGWGFGGEVQHETTEPSPGEMQTGTQPPRLRTSSKSTPMTRWGTGTRRTCDDI